MRYFLWLILFFSFVAKINAQETLAEKLTWYELLDNQRTGFKAAPTDEDLQKHFQELKEIGDFATESKLHKEVGLYNLRRAHDYSAALDSFIESLKIEDAHGMVEDKVITYIAMASVFEQVGDYHKSAALLNESMRLSERFNNTNVLIFLANKLGKLNAASGNFNEALENYELVLNLNDSIASPLSKGEALFNKAHVHARKREYAKALVDHKKSLAIRRKHSDRLNEAQSLNDIGELYRLMKNDEQALKNFVAAIKIRTEIGDTYGLAQSYSNAGILYFNQRNYTRAIANLELSLEAANSSQAGDLKARSHEFLSYCFKETKEFEKGLEHTQQYMQLMEFMRNERTQTELIESENRYVLDQKELEIRHLELQQKQREQEIVMRKKLQNFLFTIIGFGVIIISLVFFLYLTKRRATISLEAAHARVAHQNAQLHQLNATKDKFFSIISHDLKGPLNSFTSFSRMLIDYTDSLTKEEIKTLAQEIDKNLKNLFALLDNLLEWSRSQTGNIEFKPEIFDIAELLTQNQQLLRQQASNKGIIIECKNIPSTPVLAHKHSINTVIRNLISNAIKFTPSNGTISLGLISKSAELTVSVADTGVGMSPQTVKKLFRIDTKYSTNGTANERGTGLGLILCKDFIEKNGGTIGVHSEEGKGSVFFFNLPVSQPMPSSVPAAAEVQPA